MWIWSDYIGIVLVQGHKKNFCQVLTIPYMEYDIRVLLYYEKIQRLVHNLGKNINLKISA